jgi:hypothetical protein
MQREKAKEVAQDILEDRRGADYYQDIKILSSYLESQLGISKEKAEQTAKAIQEDRIGANFYENVDILADFLEK